MAARDEPGWLTAIYTAVGFVVIGLIIAAVALFIAYWPFFVLTGIASAALWFWYRSPWGIERRARDEAAQLLRQLASLDTDQFPTAEVFAQNVIATLLAGGETDLRPPKAIISALMDAAETLYGQERFTLTAVQEPPERLSSIEGGRYIEHLQLTYKKLSDPDIFDSFREALCTSFQDFIAMLPRSLFRNKAVLFEEIKAEEQPGLFLIPLEEALPELPKAVEGLILSFYAERPRSRDLFHDLRAQLDENHYLASRMPPGGKRDNSKLVMPTEFEGSNLAESYLNHTPLAAVFSVRVPFNIPEAIRFEHTHILAGSGHGKTQTLQHLILADLTDNEPRGLVIIDSQGDMLRKLSKLELFEPNKGRLADRLIVIDPSDIEHPPALNMFDVNFDRIGAYDKAAREQILNGVIELYDYMFGSLLGAELTQKQSVIFRYIARLMLAIPGATIHTLIELMNDATPFLRYVEQLPPGARMFFETEFPHKSFTDTKRQIQRRLWGILENPAFERMFTAPKNQIDMFGALNSGKIVLVNTAKDFLKTERSSFLGRFFIALTLQAALERAALPEQQRRPAFLYIDEAADYFDRNIDDLLTQARKYQLGVILSHQYLDQLAPGLRSSIATNTGIKLVGGVSERDARSIAPDMRTTPTFILAQHKRDHYTQFACHVRNYTGTALSLSIPFGSVERQPRMNEQCYRVLLEQNRSRISASSESPAAAAKRPVSREGLPAETQPSDANWES